MAGLAAVLGVTPRSLQLSFRALHGMSPRQYLERVRLDRVRARILSQGEAISVTTAALECGFTHLGRFSQVYRRTFGELPNETRARQWHLSDPDPINYPPNARNKRGCARPELFVRSIRPPGRCRLHRAGPSRMP